MLIALPELDGASNPSVFAGRHGEDGCHGCERNCAANLANKAMAPCPERIEKLALIARHRIRMDDGTEIPFLKENECLV